MKRPLSVFVLLGLFIASCLQVNAQTFPYQSCDCAAGATAGSPSGPANPVFVKGESQASDLAVTAPTGTGTTDYAYVVTDPSGAVLGLSADGSYDFSNSPTGTYGFTGIAYNQAQITTVCGLLPVICNGPTPPPDPFCPIVTDPNFECTLGNFFNLIGLIGGGQATIPSVVHIVDSIACASSFATFINVCLAVDEIPSYTITVQGGLSDECSSAATIDPFSNNGPFDNTGATGAGLIDNCFAEGDFGGAGPSDDNSLWFSFVGDGQTWHLYTSPECSGGLDLNAEGTYVDGGDTQMEIFSGSCDDLTSLGCSEDDIAYGAITPDGAGFFAGVTVATEAGVTYYIMVDGFDGAAGQFCLQAVENPCGFIELTSTDAVSVCPSETATISVNSTTLDLGLTLNGNVPQVGFYVLDPATQEVVAIVGADENLSLVVEGAAPFGDLTQVVVIPAVISNLLTQGGNTFPFIDEGCSSNIGSPVLVNYLSAAECGGGAPANDECASAIELSVTDGAVNGPFTNVDATGESSAIPPACFGDAPTSGDNYYDNSVWFMFEGTGEEITLTTDIAGIDSTDANLDTQIGVFATSCDGVEVACGDDIDGENFLSTVTIQTEAGTTYYVVVDGYYYNSLASGYAGQFNITASVTPTNACEADFGTVVLPNGFNPYVCSGGSNQAISVSGAATGAYGTIFALTSASDLTIQAINLDGSSVFDFSTLPAGEYLIHAFNFQLDQASAILAAVQIGTTTGFDVAALIASGAICADLDVVGTAIHHLTPIQANVDEGCDDNTGEVILSIAPTGGLPEYDNSFSYTVTGQLSGTIAYGETQQITAADDISYNLQISDDNGCTALASGTATCTKCHNDAGIMSSLNFDCGLNIATATATEFNLDQDAILIYALHTSADSTAGTILATDPNGSFDLTNIANGTYYISAVVGFDEDGDGAIDNLADECTFVAIGTPVVWNGVLVLNVSEDCDDASGEYVLTVSASGGVAPYALQGTFNQQLASGQVLTQNFPDDAPYQIILTDGNGCVRQAEGQPTCSKCDNNAGTMPLTATGDICTGTLGAITEGAVIAPSSILVYALHTSPDTTAGTILATNTTGIFEFSNFAPGTYYISAVVGTDENGDGAIDDLSDFCTKVAAGTPVDWNGTLVALWDVDCDVPTKTATLTLNVTGGTSPYMINGNLFNNLEYNEGDTPPSLPNLEDNTFTAIVTDANGCIATDDTTTACKASAIECLSFTGEVKASGNLLKWAVLETDNNFFTIERSADGINFTAIATVDGSGTTYNPINYSYLDKEAPNGLSYYRVVGNSFGGDTGFCNTIGLTRGEIKFGIGSLSPVPVNQFVDVAINTVNTNIVKIQVYDAIGQLVTVQTQTVIAGVNHVIMNTAQLPSGMYFLTATDGNSSATAKFIKE